MWTVFNDKYSSAAISWTVRPVGRKRSTRISAWLSGWRRIRGWAAAARRGDLTWPAWSTAQDAGDDDAVLGGLPGIPPDELRRRVKDERVQHAVGLGQLQGAVQGAAGGGLVPGRIAGDGVKEKHFHHPGRVVERDGAGDDGDEGEDCCLRIVLDEAAGPR